MVLAGKLFSLSLGSCPFGGKLGVKVYPRVTKRLTGAKSGKLMLVG